MQQRYRYVFADLAWASFIILASVATAIVLWGTLALSVRPIIVAGFLLICPGMAYVRLLGIENPFAEWVLAVACSLALDTFIAGVLVYAQIWSAHTAMIVLLATSIVGALAQIVFGWNGPTQPGSGHESGAPAEQQLSRTERRHIEVAIIATLLSSGLRMASTMLCAVEPSLRELTTRQPYRGMVNRIAWSRLATSCSVLRLLVARFVPEGPLVIGIDETPRHRRRAKAGVPDMSQRSSPSSPGHSPREPGPRWVRLKLFVPNPDAPGRWALPLLTALTPLERYAPRHHRQHKPASVCARQLIRLVHRWLPDRQLVVISEDSKYAALDLLAAVRPIATVVARLRLDARLFAPPPTPIRCQNALQHPAGQRLPTLEFIRGNPALIWTPLHVPDWHGGAQERAVEVVSDTAVWYHAGSPPVPIRWVLIRAPRGEFPTRALLCTDLAATPQQIMTWFALHQRMGTRVHAAPVRAARYATTLARIRHARATQMVLGLISSCALRPSLISLRMLRERTVSDRGG